MRPYFSSYSATFLSWFSSFSTCLLPSWLTIPKFPRRKIEVSFLVVDNRLFTAKVSHQKAQTSTALTQLEAMESDDNSEDEAIMDKIKNDESKPTRTRNLDDEEEFVEHFSDVPPSQLLLLQWYYRILPG